MTRYVQFGLAIALVSLLITKSSQAQPAAAAMHGTDVSCPDSIPRGECPLANVSLVQLLATPERFDGRHVRVIAFVHLEFEGDAAYLHREDFEANLDRNAVWLDFRTGTLTGAPSIIDRYVLLEGTFDARDRGHLGLFGGALRDITRAEPWPSRKEFRKRFAVLEQRVPAVTSVANRLIGCYRLTLGPWSKNTPLGPPTPTAIFRLDTTSARSGPPGARTAARVAPAELLAPTDPRARWLQPPWWRTVGEDSLDIVTWSTGTESEVFYGHLVGAEFRGVLRHTSDAIPVDPKTRAIQWDVWPWAPATARRIACP